MKKKFILLYFLLFACEPSTTDGNNSNPDKSQEVIDKAIARAGGENYDRAVIDYDFREYHYRSERNGGVYSYHRIREDSAYTVHDILSNHGFIRMVNEKEVNVPDSMAFKYSNSINSVIYFALLPYGLNDAAVNKKYIGETEIKGIAYHKIKVTFEEEGGGEDFEDTYLYWISKDEYEVGYLAYEFHTEGGGYRFREAVNPRKINGIRFVDYINFKPAVDSINLEVIDSLYQNNGLIKFSEINLENITVSYPKD